MQDNSSYAKQLQGDSSKVVYGNGGWYTGNGAVLVEVRSPGY